MLSDKTEAQTIGFNRTVLSEGDALTVTVTPDTGQTLTTSQIEVVTPYNCRYRANYSQAQSGTNFVFTYPGPLFQPTSDTRISGACYTTANTYISRSPGTPFYTVRSIASDVSSPTATFRVLLLQDLRIAANGISEYLRTDTITFVSRGHNPNTDVTFQLDAPTQRSFDARVLRSNAQGVIIHSFTIPPGWNNTQQSSLDLGAPGWEGHFIDFETRGKGGDDFQGFRVNKTRIQIEWMRQPLPTVPRTNLTGAYVKLTYQTSMPGQAPRLVTDEDFRGKGNRINLDVVVYTGILNQDCGTTAILRAGDTAAYVKTAGLPETGWWRIDFRSLPTDAIGPYRIHLSALNDTYANLYPSCVDPDPIRSTLLSNRFDLTTALIRPIFNVKKAEVRRADLNGAMEVELELWYPNGALVNRGDLDGTLRLQVFQEGSSVIPDKFYEPVDAGAATKFSLTGVNGILPARTPLGSIHLRIVGPATDKAQNRIDDAARSALMSVLPTQPRIEATFHNVTQATDAFLRGQDIRVVASIRYPDGSVLRDEDVQPPDGGPSRGLAIVRLQPPDGTLRSFKLKFNGNPESFPNQWITNYTTTRSDPVGLWDVVILVRDQYDNEAQINRTIRVGLTVRATLSSAEVQRSSNITVTATMTRPGMITPEPGQLNVSVSNAGQYLVRRAPMTPTAQGAYQFSLHIPFNASAGDYIVTVLGRGSQDEGREVVPFTVRSTNIAVVGPKVSSSALARLENVGVSFFLQYPNKAPVTRTEMNAPVVAAVHSATNRSVPLPVRYNANNGEWSATFQTLLDSPVGEYHFLVTGQDRFNPASRVDPFRTKSFTLRPAELVVSGLQPHRVGYDRGETVRIQADLRYADGTQVQGVTVPVDILAGTDLIQSVDLEYNAGLGLHEGTYVIKLQDPLSTPQAEWSLRVQPNAVEDAAGNAGPSQETVGTTTFAVRLAFLNVQVLEQPASGLQIGKDEAEVRFVLLSNDGTRVNAGLQGVTVLFKRGSSTVGNTTVTLDENGYRSVYGLSARNLQPGDNYHFTVQGKDKYGNEVTLADTQNFAITQASKDSPTAGAALVLLVAAVGFALRRGRRDE